MRHLGSLILSLVLAPIVYVLVGIGQVKFQSAGFPGHINWTTVGIGTVSLIVGGLLYTVLVMARISPLGPILAAILYVAVSAAAMISASFYSNLPKSVLGVSGAAQIPLAGVAVLLAVPLVATVVSPRRWRHDGQNHAVTPAYSPPPVYAAPAHAGQSLEPDTVPTTE
jgi:hypothetical protein